MSVKVCIHICRCYRVSAQFEACREAIVEVPSIVKDLCRVLYFKVSNDQLGSVLSIDDSSYGYTCTWLVVSF